MRASSEFCHILSMPHRKTNEKLCHLSLNLEHGREWKSAVLPATDQSSGKKREKTLVQLGKKGRQVFNLLDLTGFGQLHEEYQDHLFSYFKHIKRDLIN